MYSVIRSVPEIDTIVASQYSYMNVIVSGGSFQDVCGELIGVVQDHPVQSPLFIPNHRLGVFWISMIIQEMKIVDKKSKSTKISVQQMTDS